MKKIYLSPERRPAPHGPYFGYPTLFEHDVTTSIAQKNRRGPYPLRLFGQNGSARGHRACPCGGSHFLAG